ncbi:hypothetical protein KCU61_g492, partial [Aureobasidium melanogenum]
MNSSYLSLNQSSEHLSTDRITEARVLLRLRCVCDTKPPSSNMFGKESYNHIYPKPERRRNAYMLPPSSNLARHLDPVQRLALKQSARIFHDAICTLFR